MRKIEREFISESHMDERLAARAEAGWWLISVVVHPYKTEEAAPLWVCFWETEVE